MRAKTKTLMQFSILFLLLAGFTAVSIGYVSSGILSVNAAKDGGVYAQVVEPKFKWKVLQFIKEKQVCELTSEQVALLQAKYATTQEMLDTGASQVSVLYVEGTPLNKNLLERAVGSAIGEDSCQVVHGNKVVALVSPNFVS